MRYTDLMIDLETLGNTPGSIFPQIGLCAFNIAPRSDAEDTMATRDIRVSIADALEYGLRVEASTLQYWLTESQAAREEMARPGGVSVINALLNLNSFVHEHCEDSVRVWGYGPSFDIALLDSAAQIVGIRLPWPHGAVRCVRTLKEMFPDAMRPAPAVPHVGMHDAIAQAVWVQNMWREFLQLKEKKDDGTSRDLEERGRVGLRPATVPEELASGLSDSPTTLVEAGDVPTYPTGG